jgi:hypothetical protein
MKTYLSKQHLLTTANFILMAVLLFTIFIVMILPQEVQKNLYRACISLILIAAFFCIDIKYRRYMRWFLGIVIILLMTYYLTGSFYWNVVSKLAIICIYFVIAVLLVRQAASAKKVTKIVILESVNGYLMIAMFYAIIIAFVILFNPHAYSFRSPVKGTEEVLLNLDVYLYYGLNVFTTATTSDIMPVSPAAKSLSMALGLTGQMYIAIIIAMLVGKYASRDREDEG